MDTCSRCGTQRRQPSSVLFTGPRRAVILLVAVRVAQPAGARVRVRMVPRRGGGRVAAGECGGDGADLLAALL
jgi:hypothetical protein